MKNFELETIATVADKIRALAQTYFTAVSKRDSQTLSSFYTKDREFIAILPFNKTFNDIPSFLASQDHWLNGTTGKFDFTLGEPTVSGETASIVARSNYQNVDANGAFELDIDIVTDFKLIDGEWLVVGFENKVLKNTRLHSK